MDLESLSSSLWSVTLLIMVERQNKQLSFILCDPESEMRNSWQVIHFATENQINEV